MLAVDATRARPDIRRDAQRLVTLAAPPLVCPWADPPPENESRAYKWRASTFAAYERCHPSAAPEPTSSLPQAFYRTIADEIEDIVGPIARKHFPDRDDNAQRWQRAMGFVEAAGDLAAILSRQAAKLEIIDKAWFERSQTAFVCADDRMHGRLGEEDEDEEDGFQVDIILQPGFLKYGNDDGEDLEKYAVWIPAMLDLSEKGGFEEVQESIDIDTPGAQPERLRDLDIEPTAVPPPGAALRAWPERLRDPVPPPAAAVSIPTTAPPKPAALQQPKPPHSRHHHREKVAKSTPRARACRAWKQCVSAVLACLLTWLCLRHCVFLITCVDALLHAIARRGRLAICYRGDVGFAYILPAMISFVRTLEDKHLCCIGLVVVLERTQLVPRKLFLFLLFLLLLLLLSVV